MSIIPVFLCGGFGTRLEKDLKDSIEREKSGSFISKSTLPPLDQLLGLPKGLLPVNKKPLLDHWIDMIIECKSSNPTCPISDTLALLCNGYHEPQFRSWISKTESTYPDLNIKLVSNGITKNESRNGSVADLHLLLSNLNLTNRSKKYYLVIAGDTLLTNFSLSQFISSSSQLFQTNPSCESILTHYPISDTETLKSGVLETNPSSSRCTLFKEKPGPNGTSSRLGCPCFYLLSSKSISSLSHFLIEKKGKGLDEIDAFGKWVQWIVEKQFENEELFGSVYAVPIQGRLDIGGLDSYIQADQFLSSQSIN